ncbi:MAG: PIG-L deacetylase family protein [Chloroflexota bacterium]
MTTSSPTLLAVLAHPDDESFGMGGTLALYARRGYRVILLCATRGEAGTVDAEHLQGFTSVAELRESELRCAAQELGLDAVHFLGFRDSGMPGQPDNQHPQAQIAHPIDEVAGRIVKYIRQLKPAVVLTFDPVGGYRHPDHIHVNQATTLAFERSADPDFHAESGAPFQPRALYYHVFPHRFLRFVTRLMPLFGLDPRHWGRNKDIDLKALTDYDFPIHVRIDIGAVAGVKSRAGACHASQGGIQMRRGIMGFINRMMGDSENYMRAFPAVDGRHRLVRDLFEGIGPGPVEQAPLTK